MKAKRESEMKLFIIQIFCIHLLIKIIRKLFFPEFFFLQS